MLKTLWPDVRHAARSLWRSPGFTLTAVLTLGLGIAGNAAIFSVADAVLVREAPGVEDRDRLVDLGVTVGDLPGFGGLSHEAYTEYRRRNTQFTDIAAYRDEPAPFGLVADGRAARVFGSVVTDNYFSVLGVPMTIGRGFADGEGAPGNPRDVVIISERLWQRQFNAAVDVIGRTVRLNTRPFTVIGVAAPGFTGHRFGASDLWVPPTTSLDAGDGTRGAGRRTVWHMATARLRPGASVVQARAEMTRIAQDRQRERASSTERVGISVAPAQRLPPGLQAVAPNFIAILFALVGLILVVACANVGGMLLGRGVGQARDVAVRLAIGATWWHITRLRLAEGVLLGAMSAVTGIAGAFGAIGAINRMLPVLPIPLALDVRLDWRVVAFAVTVSGASGILAGLAPAWYAMRAGGARPLHGGPMRPPGRLPLQRTLLVVQVAAAVPLVVCALMLGRSITQAQAIDPGFSSARVDMVSLDLTLGGYAGAARVTFTEDLVARAARLPMVEAAGTARVTPLVGFGDSPGELWRPGAVRDRQNAISSDWNIVSPGFFDTIRTPLLQGRAFTDRDRPGAPDVIIVNETLARRLWPRSNPLDQTLVLPTEIGDRTLTVVGVARDGRYRSLGEAPRPFIYAPFAQHPQDAVLLLLRTSGRTSLPAVRELVRQLDPQMPIVTATTLRDATAVGLFPQRLAAALASGTGVVALLLSALGVYGLTAHTVSRRTREIGVRVALGAQRAQVLRLVLGQSVVLSAVGATLGLALAAGATRLLATLLFGVTPLDPVSFAGSAAVFAFLALVASVMPSRHALAINPVDALRAE